MSIFKTPFEIAFWDFMGPLTSIWLKIVCILNMLLSFLKSSGVLFDILWITCNLPRTARQNADTCKYYELRHVKTNTVTVRPAKTQISLGIRPVWSESSLSAWRKSGSLATHWAHSENSDQTGRMTRLIWVFAGRTDTLLVLSCRGSYVVHVSFSRVCKIPVTKQVIPT